MVETEEFPVALAEADAIEPMMQIPSELPVLPLRDIVIYPFMIVPLLFRGTGRSGGRGGTGRKTG